jgi:hypothetical protein
VHAQPDDAGRQGGQREPELRQHEEQEEQLDQQRGAADELDERGRERGQHRHVGPADDGEDETEDGGQGRAQDRGDQGVPDEGIEQLRQDVQRGVPVPGHMSSLSTGSLNGGWKSLRRGSRWPIAALALASSAFMASVST